MFIYFIKLYKLLHLFIFYLVSWFDKRKVYYWMFVWHFIYCIPFKFTYWKNNNSSSSIWYNIYLKHVFGTCYLISLLFPFMALENLYLMFLYVFDTKLCCSFFLEIKCFLWIFNVSPRAIVQVRIYLWQLSYSTQCIHVAVTWWCWSPALLLWNEKQTGKKHTPTNCVIAMDQW